MASSAYAWVETADNGPQQITVCWIRGTATAVSGSVVVLNTATPTYPGKEVTGSTTAGNQIYGVIDGTGADLTELANGKWVRVQTYGYVPIIRLDASVVVAGDPLYTSGTTLRAGQTDAVGSVSGSTIAFTARPTGNANGTTDGFIGL